MAGLTIRIEQIRVYNLTVNKLHNYAVGDGGVPVHNACGAGGLKVLNKKELKRFIRDPEGLKRRVVGPKKVSKFNIARDKDWGFWLVPRNKGGGPNIPIDPMDL